MDGTCATMGDVTDDVLTDEELAELALSADPDAAIADDAVPFRSDDDHDGPIDGLLPDWYMPTAVTPVRGGRRLVGTLLVVGFVAINVGGVCVTYGLPELALF